MSNSEVTRFVRVSPVAAELRRAGAANECTRFGEVLRPAQREQLPPEVVFNAWQGRMARTAREVQAKGVFIFALSTEGEFAGQVWLKADHNLRTTSIGRHSHCELFLPDADELSLRQLVVLVRRTGFDSRYRMMDLRSTGGLFTAEGAPLSSVIFSGTAVFSIPGYWLVTVPTGQIVLWDERAANPWRTLPPISVVSSEDRRAAEVRSPATVGVTSVTSLGQVPMFGAAPLLAPGEQLQGQLSVDFGGTHRMSTWLGTQALERGILLGRDGRCLAMSSGAPDDLSRVHAVVFSDEGEVFIADVGSTNGTWRGELKISSALMSPGVRFRLGKSVETWWETAH